MLLGLHSAADAQVGANIELQSDYRFRGRSISDGRPAVSFNLSYDHPSGAYLGGSVTAGKTRDDGIRTLRYVGFAGYATKSSFGPTLDVGVSRYHLTDYRGGRRVFDHYEIYGGMLTDHLSLRLHYSPDYYGFRYQAIYADVAGVVRPTATVRLFARAGMLASVDEAQGVRRPPTRYDFSAGVGKQFSRFDLRATWTGIRPRPAFPEGRTEKRNALVLTASCEI